MTTENKEMFKVIKYQESEAEAEVEYASDEIEHWTLPS